MATAAGPPLDNGKVFISPCFFDARVVAVWYTGDTTYLIQLYLNSYHAFLGL